MSHRREFRKRKISRRIMGWAVSVKQVKPQSQGEEYDDAVARYGEERGAFQRESCSHLHFL